MACDDTNSFLPYRALPPITTSKEPLSVKDLVEKMPQKSSPPRLSIPRDTTHGIKSQRNAHTSVQEFVDMPSGIAQDNEYNHQDLFTLSPAMDGQNGFGNFQQWPLGDEMLRASDLSSASDCTEASFDTKSIPTTEYDEAQMVAFSSTSHPLFSGSTGQVQAPDQHTSLSELNRVSDARNSPQVAFSSPQGYQTPATALGFPFDESKHLSGPFNHRVDGRDSIGFDSHSIESFTGWNHVSMEANEVPNGGVTQMSNIFTPLPATPPHTDGGSDIPVTSGCSQTSYQSFVPADDAMFVDISDTASLSTQNFSLGEPYYPLTPPLSDQDPNRTIRPSKQQRRPAVSATATEQPEKAESYPVPMETMSHRFKDSPESRSPRAHPYYGLPTQSDGKYHCPYSTGEKPCPHPPTTQKCAYHKYLDSHLKPYRCKVPQCVDAHFSSNACLFRHEREAHGMHGHGENPHLCLFATCERSIPGNGFPRRWNLHDHMKRVHDYATSEKASSPEGSPIVTGQSSKKKDTAPRKRKGVRVTGAQTMKRVRSTQSQTNALKAAQAQANSSQQLQKAERNYYDCLTRLREDLNCMNPEDPSVHDKANASLQELHTLALNYRHICAGQLTTDRFCS